MFARVEGKTYRMSAERISRILRRYEAGELTEVSARLEVLLAAGAGAGDAEAVFDGLPPWLKAAVARDVTEADPQRCRIQESYCGPWPNEAYEAGLRRREELMRRGIVALKEPIRARGSVAPDSAKSV
jgi:hypothetical protein